MFSRHPVPLNKAPELCGACLVCLRILISTDERAVRELERQTFVQQLPKCRRIAYPHCVVERVLRGVDRPARLIISRRPTRLKVPLTPAPLLGGVIAPRSRRRAWWVPAAGSMKNSRAPKGPRSRSRAGHAVLADERARRRQSIPPPAPHPALPAP